MQENPEPKYDVRVQATAAIWAGATGMMVFSIPLSAITHSTMIPLAVIVGAAVGTCGVWFRGKGPDKTLSKGELSAQKRITELEERLANLETINNFERRLAEESLKRLDASQNVPSGEVMKDERNETKAAPEVGPVAFSQRE